MSLSIDSLVIGRAQTKTKKATKINHIWEKEYFKPIMGFFLILAILFLSFGAYVYAYKNKIYPGIKIASIDLSNKTISEAEDLLTSKIQEIENQKIIAEVNGVQLETNLVQMGITYSPRQLTQKAFSIGHNKNWFVNSKELAQLFYKGKELNLDYNFNADSWNGFLNKLNSKISQVAENPHLEIQNGAIKIILGKAGVTILSDDFKKEVLAKVEKNDFSNINVPISISQITVPDSQAQTIISQAENYTQPIVFIYENKTYTATKDIILGWLFLNRNGENFSLEISDEAINQYIASIASKIDKKAKNKEVTPSGQVLNEGTPGIALNRTQTVVQIKQALSGTGNRQIALQTNPIEPAVKTIYPAGTPGLFPGKYIEVVLSKQTLYAFDGQNLIKQFLISSGTSRYPSPTGVFSIYSKCRSCLMAGPGYYLPGVEWISRFSGSYSIHGTYWHHNFGHPMSHGCINATNADAQFIYEWTPIGTPVYIHK